MSELLTAIAAVAIGLGFLVLVWRKGFGELSFTAGKVNAKLIARKLDEHGATMERIENAVNHVPTDEATLIERVIKIEGQQEAQMELLTAITERLDAIAPPPGTNPITSPTK